jgi:hypothetical protein
VPQIFIIFSRGALHFVSCHSQAFDIGIMPFNIKRPAFGRQDTNDVASSDHTQSQVVMESVPFDDKGTPVVPPATGASSSAFNEGLDQDAQLGVKKAQATTLTWTKTALYTTLSW